MRIRAIDINPRRIHHKDMRTTLTIDDDVLKEAVKRAEALSISLGQALSDLARRGLQVAPPVKEISGLVVFDPPKDAPRITHRGVKQALSDFP